MTQLRNLTLLLALLLCLGIQGQVTIGSTTPPLTGALLDLKQNDAPAGGATSSKGLGMPRVIITELIPATPGALAASIGGTGNWDKDEHIGLMVYHTDKCTFSGQGLYVWTGNEWQPLHKQNIHAPKFSQTYIDLPSGVNQTIPGTPYNLMATWQGGINPTWNIAAASGSTAVTLTSPVAGTTGSGTVTASPFNMAITPAAMTGINPASPWQSRESRVTFTNLATDCGHQDFVTLNQTNYALQVNNVFNNSQIIYTAPTSGNFAVRGNAAWKTTVSDPNTVLTSGTTIPASGGSDVKVTTTTPPSTTINYATNAVLKYYKANITFSDTATVKRFNDVTVSILNCSNEPTMSEWAARAGFPGVKEPNAVPAPTAADDLAAKIDTPDPATGIAWHRDQNGNIFLSSDFGSAGRWMITNLAATTFAPGVTYTGNPAYMQPTGPNYNSSGIHNLPAWGYPNTNATTYNNNKRLGLLYTWDAATAGKGGVYGMQTIDDGELANGYDPTPLRQGICPNNWYLPSDREWTALEQQISDNISLYSDLPNNPVTIELGARGYRSGNSTQGLAMLDACPAPTSTIATGGSSNVISTALHGGFGVMLAGLISNGVNDYYGSYGSFWSASGSDDDTSLAWYRFVPSGSGRVYRAVDSRADLYSVRCKK